jgi:hypothetical protein
VLLLYWKYAKTCFSSTSKCYAPTLEKDKNMFVRFCQNKCSKFLIIFLSKVCCKKRHELCKNIYKKEMDTKEVQNKKKNKKKKMRKR